MWQVVLYVSPITCSIVGILTILACVAAEFLARRHGDVLRSAAAFFLMTWALLVLAVTVVPDGSPTGAYDQIYWLPGEGLLYGTAGMDSSEIMMVFKQEAANAIMFIPLAIFGYYASRRTSRRLVLAGCMGFSFLIELTQWLERAGRTADVDDLTFNSLGAGFGLLAITIASFAVTASRENSNI